MTKNLSKILSGILLCLFSFLHAEAKPSAAIAGPDNLHAQGGVSDIELKWEASDDFRTIGYDVYRSGSPRGNYRKINKKTVDNTFYLDTNGINENKVYYYKVKAVSGNKKLKGNFSKKAWALSGRLSFFIPAVYGEPGETVTIPLNLQNADNLILSAGDLVLQYDPDLMEIVKVKETLLTWDFIWSANISPPYVVISYVSGPGAALKGEGRFLSLEVKIKKDAAVSHKAPIQFVKADTAAIKGTTLWVKSETDPFKEVDLNLIDGKVTVGGDYRLGDVTGDTAVLANDASSAMVFADHKAVPSKKQIDAGDIEGDGEIGANDGHSILYWIVNQAWPPDINPKSYEGKLRRSLRRLEKNSPRKVSLKGDGCGLDSGDCAAGLQINNPDKTASFYFKITYDPEMARFSDFAAGQGMGTDFACEVNEKKTGKGSVEAVCAAREGKVVTISKPVSLGALKFTPLKKGTAIIRLADVKLYDFHGKEFQRSDLNIAIKKSSSSIRVR
ncbi:MAG: hypothetical protein HZA01_15355 [Nitrospinae bacterium]|nr:hypothetical protein [Nitrospinota bacterium]